MEPSTVAALMLASVLIGVLIPLILQARNTLRSVQRTIDEVGPRAARTLDELRATAHQVNLVAKAVADGTPHVTAFLESIGTLTAGMNQLRASLKVASAVGPAVAAGIMAWRKYRPATPDHERSGRNGAEQNSRGEAADQETP